jgi:uracil-DNA glycosylase
MIPVSQMTALELAALSHFYAEAGVDTLLEDAAIDRFVEFSAMQGARAASSTAPKLPEKEADSRSVSSRQPAEPRPLAPQVAMPDEQAVEMARAAANAAMDFASLKHALETFTGCNLKNGARSTIFASGDLNSKTMVIGPMPNADDDREGTAFSGQHGQMLDRMLSAIGLGRQDVLLTQVIAWRPPGNRAPHAAETEICRPFIERQILIAQPRHILILGNFAARFFIGGTENIQTLRGKWRNIDIQGQSFAALPTLHPQDLATAPVSKRLAWQDLLLFRHHLENA